MSRMLDGYSTHDALVATEHARACWVGGLFLV
jgi:hypothetical protein